MKTEQDSDVEKRLLLAIVLSMAILFGTPYVYEKLNLTTPAPEPVSEEMLGEAPPPSPIPPPVTAEPEVDPPAAESVVEPTAARPATVEVDTEDMRLVFTNVGAALISVQLKQFTGPEGEWLELLPQNLPADTGKPLLLQTDDPTLNRLLAQSAYEVIGPRPAVESGFQEVLFELRQDDVTVSKRLLLPTRGYLAKADFEVRKGGMALPGTVLVGPGIGTLGQDGSSDFQDPAVAFYQNAGVEHYYVDDLEEKLERSGGFPWAAVDSKYFAYVLLSESGIKTLKLESLATDPLEPDEEPVYLVNASATLGTNQEFSYYLGPKRSEDLAVAHPSLPQLIDYGWFGVLVRPLLTALKFIYGFVQNWGWAIIVLTFLINLALFPFRYKQMASMQKMSALQPQLKSIQDKYKRMKKEDPRRQQMNAEVMAMYKEHGVNPLGGCLPLLLQMPILFAFYRMLYASIELRGAPFMLWIQDLSKPDPYYVTPIVMGATMVAQQKMTPATGDAAQRRMMMFLPILFTFFFLQVSSGLAIYFLFSNVFGMALQFGLQKLKPELATKGKKKPAGKAKGKKQDNEK